MNSLRDLFKIMGEVALFVVVGMLASLPSTLVMYLAIENESWLLGVLTFVLFVLTISVGVYLEDRWN